MGFCRILIHNQSFDILDYCHIARSCDLQLCSLSGLSLNFPYQSFVQCMSCFAWAAFFHRCFLIKRIRCQTFCLSIGSFLGLWWILLIWRQGRSSFDFHIIWHGIGLLLFWVCHWVYSLVYSTVHFFPGEAIFFIGRVYCFIRWIWGLMTLYHQGVCLTLLVMSTRSHILIMRFTQPLI